MSIVTNSISAENNSEDNSDTSSHYAVLGLGAEASPEEIKNAYFGLIRVHRSRENPEKFQQINDAFFTLSDSQRRGAYDQTRSCGRRMQVLVDQAAKSHEKDPQKAIALLRSAIAMAPDVARPRVLLAQVLTRTEEYEEAEKQYLWLIRNKPRDETLRFKLARCLWLQKRLSESEKILQGALKLNARYYEGLILLSRLQEAMDDTVLAADTMEQAIDNDGKENYADVDALLRLLVLHLLNQKNEEAEAVGERLLHVIPADGSERTNKAVQCILRRANEMYQAEHFQAAQFLLYYASQRIEGLDEAAKQQETLLHALTLRKEARLLQKDRLAEGALKAYLELRYLDHAPETLRQKLEILLSRLQGEIALKPRDVMGVIDYIHRQYPAIAGQQERLLTELYDRAAQRLAANAAWEGKAREAQAAKEAEEAQRPQKRGLMGWLRTAEK